MTGIVVEISRPPFGHEQTFAGLYVASAALSKGHDVLVLLRGDGVYAALSGQIDTMENIHLPPTEVQIEDIIELEGRVVAVEPAVRERGIRNEDMITGIEILSMDDAHELMLGMGERIITF